MGKVQSEFNIDGIILDKYEEVIDWHILYCNSIKESGLPCNECNHISFCGTFFKGNSPHLAKEKINEIRENYKRKGIL